MSDGDETRKPGFLAAMRRIERRARDMPRIGRSRRPREEPVRLGQDPFLAFPDSDLSEADRKGGKPTLRARFLGFFGPFGALPLNTTEEVLRWFQHGDRSYVAFVDILVTRFQQLFYRSWSDARPITQFDHPDDRFQTYLLSLVGLGTPGFRDRDTVPDTNKLRMVPLALSRVRSTVRLRQMLQLHFDTRVEIEEFVPSWMVFEPDSLSRLGEQCGTLGRDVHLGSRVVSVGEKIRVDIYVQDLASYRRFLPRGPDHAQLRDIVAWYLGHTLIVEVAVHLPADELPILRLGEASEVSYLARIPLREPEPAGTMVVGTTYLLEPAAPSGPYPAARAA